MGFIRALVIAFFGLLGVVIGAVAFLGLGLFAVSPPAISSAAPGQNWDVTVEISDAFLATQLSQPREGQPVQLREPKVAMKADGTLTITGNAGVGGGGAAPSAGGGRLPINPSNVNVPVTIQLRPSVSAEGKLTVEVVSAQFGPLPVPGQLGALLEGPVNDQIANALNGQPFTLTELTMRDGGMQVRAKQTNP